MCSHSTIQEDGLPNHQIFKLPPLADIDFHGAQSVDGVTLVRVDGDAEEAGVGVDQLVLVPHHGVPQHTGVPEVSQVSHVLRTIKLRRVHLTQCIK